MDNKNTFIAEEDFKSTNRLRAFLNFLISFLTIILFIKLILVIFDEPKTENKIFEYIDFLFLSVAVLFIVYLIFKINSLLKKVMQVMNYQNDFYEYLNKLGKISFIASFISFFVIIIYELIKEAYLPDTIFDFRFDYSLILIVLGLMFKSCAEILRIGLKLKEENDLTV